MAHPCYIKSGIRIYCHRKGKGANRSAQENPEPKNLRLSRQSKLNIELYDGAMDFDEDIINKLSYQKLATLCTERNQQE
jgi:hypothetical protein